MGSPWTTNEAEHLFLGQPPIRNLSSVDFLFTLSSLLPLTAPWLSLTSGKVCWASVCLTLSMEDEHQAEIEGELTAPWVHDCKKASRHYFFQVWKSFSRTILYMRSAEDRAGLVRARQMLLLSTVPSWTISQGPRQQCIHIAVTCTRNCFILQDGISVPMATKLSMSPSLHAADQPSAAHPCGLGCSRNLVHVESHRDLLSVYFTSLNMVSSWCPMLEVSERPSLLRPSNNPLWHRTQVTYLSTCQNFITFSYLLVMDEVTMPMASWASSGYISENLSWNKQTCGISGQLGEAPCPFPWQVYQFPFPQTVHKEVIDDALGGKGACWQASQPEFNSQNLHVGRRELMPRRCPLTSTYAPYVLTHAHTWTHTLTHRHTYTPMNTKR